MRRLSALPVSTTAAASSLIARAAASSSSAGGGSVWDRLDKKLLAEELRKRTGGQLAEPSQAAKQSGNLKQKPRDATIEELLDKRTGITFDVIGHNAEEDLWGDDADAQPSSSASATSTSSPAAAAVSSAAAAPSGVAPSGDQKAATKHYHTSAGGGAAAAGDASGEQHRGGPPRHGYRLLDRLKDAQLQRDWRQALGLFCTSVMQERVGSWQPFHFDPLFQTLVDSRRLTECDAVWKAMKRMERPPVDEFLVSRLMNVLGRVPSAQAADLAYDIGCFATVKGIEVKGAAEHFFLMSKVRRASWIESISILQDASPGQADHKAHQQLRIRDINRLLLKSPDEGAAQSLLALAERAGITRDAGTYAALVASLGRTKGWEFALQTFNEAVAAGVVGLECLGSSELLHATLSVVSRHDPPLKAEVKRLALLGNLLPPPPPPKPSDANQSDSVAVVKPIVRPQIRSVERLMLFCFRMRNWARACEVFKWTTDPLNKPLGGPCIVPSERANSLYIEAMSRGHSNNAKIVSEFADMQRKGLDTSNSVNATLALINAYSSRQVQNSRRKFR